MAAAADSSHVRTQDDASGIERDDGIKFLPVQHMDDRGKESGAENAT